MSDATFTPPKPYPKRGGSAYHKPGCKCMACTRRGRPAKAESGRDGDSTDLTTPAPEVLYADEPILAPYVATGNSARDRVAQWIYMRAAEPGVTTSEVARRLGIAPASLNTILYRAKKQGWLQIDDPLSRVEIELLPKIVENVNFFLDEKSEKMTIEAMKGLLVPLFKDSHGIEENKIQMLGIKIEMPPGEVTARGVIHGTPRGIGTIRDDKVKETTFSHDEE